MIWRIFFYYHFSGTTIATEVVQFYFHHCGTTAALPVDDLADYSPLCTLPPRGEVFPQQLHALCDDHFKRLLINFREEKKFEVCPLLRLSSLTSFGPNSLVLLHSSEITYNS